MAGAIHLVPAGRPIGVTACGHPTETPDRPWREGLIPDSRWTGPFGNVTCTYCRRVLHGEAADKGRS